LERYRRVQSLARSALEELRPFITQDVSELDIARRAGELLASRGIHEAWYHGLPALVLAGPRTLLSVSGEHYRPSKEKVGRTNLITIDLSPLQNGFWGDCARTLVIESGRVTIHPHRPDFKQGLEAARSLHREMRGFVGPETTFHELHAFSDDLIRSQGFRNLDFKGNLGHSIEKLPEDRIYVEKGNHGRLMDAGLFTFEPHIALDGGSWGFKHENIYYFNEQGKLEEL